MSFDPSVPNSAQSPSLFPTQNNNNNTRLKTIINADHVFNDSAQATDGYHRQMTLLARATVVALPSGSNAVLYVALDSLSRAQLYFYNGLNNVQITPTLAIRAAVAFDKAGAIQSQFNVSSVTRQGTTSRYTINFTNAMPNANYIVQVTGMRPDANTICNGSILGNTFASSVTTTFVKVIFTGGSSSEQDIERGYVTIFSVT